MSDAFSQVERVGITGLVLTRMDGDGRGGAALSMRAVTGKPIKLMGVGEKADALEDFHPQRVADRILGMGDIVALVEKAAANIDAEKAARMAAKMSKGEFDMNDLAEQLKQMQKLGGMSGVLGLMPGMGKMKNQMADSGIDDRMILRQEAIISSMTKAERDNVKDVGGFVGGYLKNGRRSSVKAWARRSSCCPMGAASSCRSGTPPTVVW